MLKAAEGTAVPRLDRARRGGVCFYGNNATGGQTVEIRSYMNFLHRLEVLKRNTRHAWAVDGRRESVAEHSWRLAVMALLCRDEFPGLDMEKVLVMCLIHDWGEAVTGDIPAFRKTEADEQVEAAALRGLLTELPEAQRRELQALFDEMEAMESGEARLFKALDNMEAVFTHNEGPLESWLPLEHEENLVYGQRNCAAFPWTAALREALRRESLEKLRLEGGGA